MCRIPARWRASRVYGLAVAVIKAWRTADRTWRVEVARERGRDTYRVLLHGGLLGECASVEQVEALLAGHGVSLADLIED